MARPCLALLLAGLLPLSAAAQVIVSTPYGGGVGFRYYGGRLSVSGFVGGGAFVPYYPYGIVQSNVSIQVVAPTVVVTPRRQLVQEVDLSGVDLDRVPASVIWGEEKPRNEVARVVPPPAARKVEAPAPPRKPEPAPPRKPEAVPPKRPVDELLEPRPEPIAEARRLVELGIRAFREEDYGIAALRFRQATEIDRTSSRAFFLLGWAEYAFGNYRDAVGAIREGLRLQPVWPATEFRPKLELYDGRPDAWALHRERLVETQKRRPRDGDYLFLLGVIDWFGDRRRDALEWFRQAAPLLPDRAPVDLFLKSPAAPPLPV